MLPVPPDITLRHSQPAYSPKAAGAVLHCNAITVKRMFERGDLQGEMIPSRGKKQFYAIYPDSLLAVFEQRVARSAQPAFDADVISLLSQAQTNGHIQELTQQLALLKERLEHRNLRILELETQQRRLQQVIQRQAAQLASLALSHDQVLADLFSPEAGSG